MNVFCRVGQHMSDIFYDKEIKIDKKSDTRDLILQTAAKLFRDHGYSGTTLRLIANNAGLKAGSIYYHFTSKEEIVDEVLNVGITSLHVAVQEAVAQAQNKEDHREIIGLAIKAHMRVVFSKADFSAANMRLHSQLPDSILDQETVRRLKYGELWDGLLLAARQSGELRQDIGVGFLRQFILGAMNWNIEWFDSQRSSVDALADRVVHLVFDGVFLPK